MCAYLSTICFALTICIFLFGTAQARCGYDGVLCIGIPRGCISGNTANKCEAVFVIIATGTPFVRLDLVGMYSVEAIDKLVFGPSGGDKWVGISFSQDGFNKNSASVICMMDDDTIKTKLSWNTLKDNLQPNFADVSQTPLKVLGLSPVGFGMNCSVLLPIEFTVSGETVNLGLMPYYTVATGIIENGTPKASEKADTYLATRVRSRTSDQTILSPCNNTVNEDSEKECDMKEYNKAAAAAIMG